MAAMAAFGLLAGCGAALADNPSFTITFKDGVVTPAQLQVPAKTQIVLNLVNSGKTPAEFESIPLHEEKVLAPGVTMAMVIHTLDPGKYSFFDDFHPGSAPAMLIAK